MKIFSNFDTKLREKKFEEYKHEYGADNVLCFGRSKLYRVIKVFLPTIFLLLVSALVLILSYRWFGMPAFWYVMIGLLLLDTVIFFPVVSKYIDYKMDFIIVIPSCMIMYDQSGIFKKNVITISAISIKTISIKKNKFLYSLFDNGDVIILTEGDVAQNGEITLRRIPRPEKRRNQMARVVGIDLQANQNPH